MAHLARPKPTTAWPKLQVLGPRRTLTGEPLAPVLAATAAAQAAGLINGEHVDKIRDAMNHIPGLVDTPTREQIETELVRLAAGVGPTELKKAADRVLFLLDQDGPEPDDTERARKRGLHVSPQRRDGTVDVKGTLTPEAWAIYEAIFAKTAAPGMCNPDDENPCLSGTPSQEQIDTDHRTLAQRQHDALVAIGRNALESGELGQHNGLPTSIIIRTTLQDLESRAGVGTTGGGTLMPINDVIRLAGHAHHWLAVFDKATGQALDLFRTRRTASPAQRIMLIARDGGCTKPCCAVPAYGAQVHHALRDWAEGGNTNVNDMTLACGPDNRSVEKERLDHHHQRPRRRRMDPTTRPRHRPNPHQLLPPPRTTPTPTKRRRRKPRTRTISREQLATNRRTGPPALAGPPCRYRDAESRRRRESPSAPR